MLFRSPYSYFWLYPIHVPPSSKCDTLESGRSTALPNTPFDCSQDRSQASFSESGSAHCLSLVLGSPPGEENGTHSSVLARKVPWTEEHGRLQSTGSQKVGYDWVTSLRLFSTYSLNQSVCNTQAHSWLHFTHTHRHTDAHTHTHVFCTQWRNFFAQFSL